MNPRTTLLKASLKVRVTIVVTEITTRRMTSLYKDAKCNFCRKKGNVGTACLLKKGKQKIGSITGKKTSVVKNLHTSDRQTNL